MTFPRRATRRLPSTLRAVALAFATSATLVAPTARAQQPTLTMVASFAHQVTGVTVSKDGRIFVNFPRWTEDTAISVAELKDGQLIAFPNAEWNAWRNARKDEVSARDHWVCVQSVVTDLQGHVWVLDAAAPAMGAVVKEGPKLVEIDLSTNRAIRTIAFDESIAPQGSYLNDVRFAPDGKTAYLTDSGAVGALVVVDLGTGAARRVLAGHPSTQPDKSVTVMYDGHPLRRPDGRGVEFSADGLALSVDGKTLYWQAIKGKTLYSVPTLALRTPAAPVAAEIVAVGENGPADGLIISRHDGRMYVSSPQDDAIRVRSLDAPGSSAAILLKDARLRWPDTFAEGPDGSIYVTTSHIQDSAFYDPTAPAALPTQLWRFKPGS